jgi:hypothetical protein
MPCGYSTGLRGLFSVPVTWHSYLVITFPFSLLPVDNYMRLDYSEYLALLVVWYVFPFASLLVDC